MGILGLAQGFSIPIAQEFGKGDKARVKRAVAMSLLLSAALSILLTLLGLAARGPVLRLLKTPEDIFDSAVAYITVLFIGLSAVMAYNMASSILRAFGDGRTPLIAMVVASAMNILLDLLFVLVFRWGVVGAAVATVIAQVLAFLYCALILSKSQ
ncbi:MATE family efflux transporter [Acutalibacter muris]|uniref:MATE family efflux transporter n=1 Tax=Acutalibacter muris TaxID=1796620 RepID=UPI0026F40507|nr:MATE family efflux transporter [Acutalibacter muris]